MTAAAEVDRKCTRVLLVDDHPLYRDALRGVLSREPGIEVCGEAGTAAEARRLCAELRPDLVLLDLALPDGNGLEFLEECRDWAEPPKVLVVTVRDEKDQTAVEALRLGAAGFVSKGATGDQLLGIVRTVRNGRTHVPPGVIERLLRKGP